MNYKLTSSPSVLLMEDDGSETLIPADETDVNFRKYLEFLGNGGVPLPSDAPILKPVAIVQAYVFRDRFTEGELMAINSLAYSGDSMAQLLLLKVSTATDGIDLASQSVADGLNYLVSVGAIASDRLLSILAPL
jgi:hypothetical protein